MHYLIKIWQAIRARPRTITVVLVLLVWAWVGTQILGLITGHEVSETDLVQRQVKVNQSTLDQLNERFIEYRLPQTTTSIPDTLFANPESSTQN